MPAIWAAGITAVGSVAAAASRSAPAIPGVVASDPFGNFDHSGWTVSTGAGDAVASRTEKTAGGGGMLADLLPWVIVGAVGIAIAKAWGKK